MRNLLLGLIAAAALATAAPALAQERGTADEAKALFDKAIAEVKADGLDKAAEKFNGGEAGGFKQKDLYVFCMDYEGTWKAMGANPKVVGNAGAGLNLTDANGKFLVKDMIEVAKTKGSGMVEYYWPNPVSKKIEPKASYIQKVGDTSFCGVGYYK